MNTQIIDAEDLHIYPGFIDAHSHSDQNDAKNVLKIVCFAGKKTIWLCVRYKVLGNATLY